MFKKILLAVTPQLACQRAAEMAFALGKQNKAKVYIFHSCGLPSEGWSSVRYLLPSGKVSEIKKEIQDYYKDIIEEFKLEDYDVHVTPGIPDTEILRFARKERIDLIIMGPHAKETEIKRSKMWGMAGSSLEKVSQKAQCPVMIVSENVNKVFATSAHKDRQDFRILVVDDEQSIRSSLQEWLNQEGFYVDIADSGDQALDKLSKKPYNLMLTDIRMSEMDGVELLKRSKKTFPELLVIMMTAYATVDTAVDSMKTGSVDYLTKPFEPDLLISKIVKLYENFEAARGVKVSFSNIMIATDFSEPADCAFDFSARMAQYHESKLHIFHALPIGDGLDALKIGQANIENNIKEALEIMKKRYGANSDQNTEYLFESWEGTPYVEILKYARWKNADLIIMAHHSKNKDPEQAFLGSNVCKVALSSRCPVISINKDFIASCANL